LIPRFPFQETQEQVQLKKKLPDQNSTQRDPSYCNMHPSFVPLEKSTHSCYKSVPHSPKLVPIGGSIICPLREIGFSQDYGAGFLEFCCDGRVSWRYRSKKRITSSGGVHGTRVWSCGGDVVFNKDWDPMQWSHDISCRAVCIQCLCLSNCFRVRFNDRIQDGINFCNSRKVCLPVRSFISGNIQ
jgi:hypothetical protein